MVRCKLTAEEGSCARYEHNQGSWAKVDSLRRHRVCGLQALGELFSYASLTDSFLCLFVLQVISSPR